MRSLGVAIRCDAMPSFAIVGIQMAAFPVHWQTVCLDIDTDSKFLTMAAALSPLPGDATRWNGGMRMLPAIRRDLATRDADAMRCLAAAMRCAVMALTAARRCDAMRCPWRVTPRRCNATRNQTMREFPQFPGTSPRPWFWDLVQPWLWLRA